MKTFRNSTYRVCWALCSSRFFISAEKQFLNQVQTSGNDCRKDVMLSIVLLELFPSLLLGVSSGMETKHTAYLHEKEETGLIWIQPNV